MIHIHVDGSYKNETVYWAFVALKQDRIIHYDQGVCIKYIEHRNITGELSAVLHATKWLNGKPGIVYFDYNGIKEWAEDNWKTNYPMTQSYRDTMSKIKNIKFIKIDRDKNLADQLLNNPRDFFSNNPFISGGRVGL